MTKAQPGSGIKRKYLAELIEIAESTRDQLLAPTVPLYQDTARRGTEVVASGVLVLLAGIRFLFTAGHVLDMRSRGQLLVGVSPELLTLAGEPLRLRSPGSTGPTGDRIDMGIVRLRGYRAVGGSPPRAA